MWQQLDGQGQAAIITAVVMVVLGIVTGLLAWYFAPAVPTAAVAVGCGVTSIGLAVQALRIGSSG